MRKIKLGTNVQMTIRDLDRGNIFKIKDAMNDSIYMFLSYHEFDNPDYENYYEVFNLTDCCVTRISDDIVNLPVILLDCYIYVEGEQ